MFDCLLHTLPLHLGDSEAANAHMEKEHPDIWAKALAIAKLKEESKEL